MAFRDGKPSSMDVSILHKDGYRVPIVLRTMPIRNSRGAVIGASESFEKNRSASEWSRRHSVYADLENFHKACSVCGAKRETLAVDDRDGLEGRFGSQEQIGFRSWIVRFLGASGTPGLFNLFERAPFCLRDAEIGKNPGRHGEEPIQPEGTGRAYHLQERQKRQRDQ
jgi:hypothetical protein